LPEKSAASNLPPKRQRQTKQLPADRLRVLMLDTAAVRAFAGLLQSFEHQTGIGTELTLLPHNRLLSAIESDADTYDVVLFDLPWLPKLAGGGVLRDLTAVLAQVEEDTFFPGCLEHYSAFRGRYYGIPFLYGPQIFYYRKDLFQSPALRAQYERRYGASLRPPITFEEFNTMAVFFTEHTDAISYGAGLAAAYAECFAPEIYLRLRAYGGQLFNSWGEVCLDNAAGFRAYENLRQALPGMKPDWRKATDTSILADFLHGESAMVISYPPFLTDVADLRKASMIGEIGYALCPGRAPLLGGWSLGVSSGTTRWDAACRFLLWCCNRVTASYFALLGGQSAVASTYTNDELVSLYPWLPLYHSAYASSKPMEMPVRISADQVDEAVCRWAWALLEGRCSTEEALRRTREDLEILRK
ncbi:MAG: extracellular solute-binding protein, partial [Clostridia bacterium]|nr:extracellular solute-binding protein [Clostridia bacterium]